MIHLYLRAIRATNTKELEDVTIETAQYYLKRTNKIRLTYTESAADSIFITSFESHSILLNIIRPARSFSIVDAYYYTIAAPYFVSQGGSPGCYLRVVIQRNRYSSSSTLFLYFITFIIISSFCN